MQELQLTAFSVFATLIYPLSILLLYFIIKFAVKNAVKEANWDLIESVRSIERKVDEIRKSK